MKHLDKDIEWPCYGQEKLSGCAVYVYLNNPAMDSAVEALNPRTGTRYTLPDGLLESLLEVAKDGHQYTLCCEGLAGIPTNLKDATMPMTEADTIGAWQKGPQDGVTLYLALYDMTGPSMDGEPVAQRMCSIEAFAEYLSSGYLYAVETRRLATKDAAAAWFTDVVEGGGEGLVLKNAKALWENGKPKGYVKMKAEADCTLRVTGVQPHSKNPALIGALVCNLDDDPAFIVEVGAGLSARMRETEPLDIVGSLIDVTYHRVSDTGNSLLLPRFKSIRTDIGATSKRSEL